MEEKLKTQQNIVNFLAEEYIFVPLYVDDKREAEKELWRKSELRSHITLNRIGSFHNELQILLTQTGSQPYFVILDDEGKSKSEIGYCDNLSDFDTFLNEQLFKP